ncbi:Heterokaryon incompatibility protein 6, OR allele [Colletotrichum siamense]|uniref:Heterokaryon incompatibility protein 6, OR allele n=1 Tax=Colletotrichum siamense TaxID=690259 RepID=A0A9P5BLS0_COLSI|nr:Heterokaryon incompatibility protein 6, OR allele [Colletotrichum siamense]KAF4843803.1 Heterokaryon incompatibility protein 6, OR allele [Colletotrichum siamense]
MSSVPSFPEPHAPVPFTYNDDRAILPSASTHIRLLELYSSSGIGPEPASAAAIRTDEGDSDAHFSSPLVCEISSTPVATPRLFKALSYTWGRPDKTHTIEISGSRLGITASLDAALRHLRSRDEKVTLWIDQICINQDDAAEKTEQVPLMTQIYSKAQQVLVWLGPAQDESDALMDCWEEIGRGARELDIESYFNRERLPLLRPLLENRNSEDELTRRFQALIAKALPMVTELLQAVIAWNERLWFGRVWIIQEQALCPDTVFVCGSKVVDVDLFFLAGMIFDHCFGRIAEQNELPRQQHQLLLTAQDRRVGPLLAIRRRQRNYVKGAGPGDDLFQLLRKTYIDGNAQATLPRDRIYGLLSIAVDADRLGITPDYKRPDCHPTFVETARALIQAGRVEILSFSQMPKDIDGLPSWVPDWRPGLTRSFTAIYDDAEKFLTAAAGDSTVEIVHTDDSSMLGICGYAVDLIEETGEVWEWEAGHAARAAHLQTIKAFCEKSAAKSLQHGVYESQERQSEAAWRVPIGDLYWTPTRTYHIANLTDKSDYEDCISVLTTLTEYETLTPEDRQERLEEFFARSPGQAMYGENMDKMTGKRPFTTRRQGYVGMGPADARPGDVVVILLGSRIPYVLRPSGDGTTTRQENTYRFVGEAYCDGVMYGEVLVTKRVPKTIFFVV